MPFDHKTIYIKDDEQFDKIIEIPVEYSIIQEMVHYSYPSEYVQYVTDEEIEVHCWEDYEDKVKNQEDDRIF